MSRIGSTHKVNLLLLRLKSTSLKQQEIVLTHSHPLLFYKKLAPSKNRGLVKVSVDEPELFRRSKEVRYSGQLEDIYSISTKENGITNRGVQGRGAIRIPSPE